MRMLEDPLTILLIDCRDALGLTAGNGSAPTCMFDA